LRLELYDERLAAGERLTDYDGKILHALENSVRLALRELGLKSGISERLLTDPNISAMPPTKGKLAT
jgi:hypothetical protein